MPHNLLFVCAANVCRSPLMAFSFAIPAFEGSLITSRGVSAQRGQTMCSLAAETIAGEPNGETFAALHRSRSVTMRDIERHDLIITASHAERAAIAVKDPAARSRTFILREAIVLAEAASMGSGGDVPEYAALLHARRGRVPMPLAKRSRFGRLQPDPLDIRDGHREGSHAHTTTLREVRADIDVFRQQLTEFLANVPATAS